MSSLRYLRCAPGDHPCRARCFLPIASGSSSIGVAIKLPKIDIYQYWHERFHRDPGNHWIQSIFKSLFRKSSATMDAR
jgi:hypothetical protein